MITPAQTVEQSAEDVGDRASQHIALATRQGLIRTTRITFPHRNGNRRRPILAHVGERRDRA